jgi:hypothetical protein
VYDHDGQSIPVEMPSTSVRAQPVISWSLVLPGALTAGLFASIAIRMEPPAPDVAEICATIVAVLLGIKLIAWVAQTGSRFHREERLAAFVMAAAIALSWLGVREVIHEAAFDEKVRTQKRELVASTAGLSREIASFLEGRRQVAPPVPRPETWERDDQAWVRFENQTTATYERRFAARVRTTHDLLGLRNMRDRDLDAFYRLPANDFQMGVVAQKLGLLAQRLAREDTP